MKQSDLEYALYLFYEIVDLEIEEITSVSDGIIFHTANFNEAWKYLQRKSLMLLKQLILTMKGIFLVISHTFLNRKNIKYYSNYGSKWQTK